MATAESVKAKIEGLIATANAKTGNSDTTLTAAVNALVDGFGGGGGSGIIDVTELPTEGINEDAIYEVTQTSAELWIVSGGTAMTLSAYFEQLAGIAVTFDCVVVDSLPSVSDMKLPDTNTFIYYVYVLSDTGVGYTTPDGTTVMTIADMAGGSNKGWSEDINSETEDGVYAVKSESSKRYVYVVDDWVEIVQKGKEFNFKLSADGTHYIVSAGSALPAYAVIPSTYNGLPVTEIAENGFMARTGLVLITIPDSVTSMGENAFDSCRGLFDIIGGAGITKISRLAFNSCNSLFEGTPTSVAWNITEIGEYAFQGCRGMRAFAFGEGLVSIGIGAFTDCNSMMTTSIGDTERVGLIRIPASVETIENYAFGFLNSCRDVHFLGTPKTIASYAFGGYALANIYVPWAEGAVANAPWGATNATIHYNSDTANM